MERFFNQDNPVTRFLSYIFDLILLNILFILTSLPIFTIGASLTALYSALLWRERDDDYTIRLYFSSFKKNFRQATLIWVPCSLAVAFLAYELYLVFKVLDPSFRFLQFPVWISLFLLTSILIYAFPMIAGYSQTIPQLLKNSILISVSNIVVTISILAVSFVIADFGLHNGDMLVLLFSLYLFIGFSLTVRVISFYLKHVFKKIEEKKEES